VKRKRAERATTDDDRYRGRGRCFAIEQRDEAAHERARTDEAGAKP
jgi:hypothetical protein